MVGRELFIIIAVYPHPPYGWIHFAAGCLDWFEMKFWRALSLVKDKLASLEINVLRIGLRESEEKELIDLFLRLGFSEYQKILIMEKVDFRICCEGNLLVTIRRAVRRIWIV